MSFFQEHRRPLSRGHAALAGILEVTLMKAGGPISMNFRPICIASASCPAFCKRNGSFAAGSGNRWR